MEPADQAPLFKVFILPAGFRHDPQRGLRLRLSLLFELNPDHPAFSPPKEPTPAARAGHAHTVAQWRKQLSAFYCQLDSYFHLFKPDEESQPLPGFQVVFTAASGAAQAFEAFSLGRQAAADPQAAQQFGGEPAIALFEEFVGLLMQRDHTKSAAESTSDDNNKYLTPAAYPPPPPVWGVRSTDHQVPPTVTSDPARRYDASKLLAGDFTDYLRALTGGLSQISLDTQRRIEDAATTVQKANEKRTYDLLGLPEDQLVKTLSVPDLADKMRGMPSRILAAYDLLHSSPVFRCWLGTIIDVEVAFDEALLGSYQQVGLQFTGPEGQALSPANQDAESYFAGHATGLLLAQPLLPAGQRAYKWVPGAAPPAPAALPQVVVSAPTPPAPADALAATAAQAGALPLQESRILSFEAEAVLQNATEAAAASAATAQQLSSFRAAVPAGRALQSQPGQLQLSSSFAADGLLQSAVRQAANHVTNVRTKGHALYLTTAPPADTQAPTDPVLHAPALTAGYLIYMRKKEGGTYSPWLPLTQLTEALVTTGQAAPLYQKLLHQGVHYGAGVLMQEGTKLSTYQDLFLFVHDGTNLAVRNPLRHYDAPLEPPGGDDPHLDVERRAVELEEARRTAEQEAAARTQAELTALQHSTAALLGTDYYPFSTASDPPRWRLQRQAHRPTGAAGPGPGFNLAKLKFTHPRRGGEYEYLALPQYLNGYAPAQAYAEQPGGPPGWLAALASAAVPFYRQEHLGSLVVSLAQPIYAAGTQQLLPQHLGESHHDLVVRRRRAAHLPSNDACVRYLLPPRIPGFQTLLWDAGPLRQKLGASEYEWFLKSQCGVGSAQAFANNQQVGQRRHELGNAAARPQGCPAGCPRYCGGSQPDTVYNGRLNYLPDPAATGFVVRFFLDEDGHVPAPEYPEQVCPFDTRRDYPHVRPWRLTLVKDEHPDQAAGKIDCDPAGRELTVHLRPGSQLFAQAIATYDPFESPFDPAPQLAKYYQQPAPGAKNAATAPADSAAAKISRLQDQLAYDPVRRNPPLAEAAGSPLAGCFVDALRANITRLSFTYACQQPTVVPGVEGVRLCRFDANPDQAAGPGRPAGAFTASVALHFEHLNVQQGHLLEKVAPTGELELFALWNDYADDSRQPSRSLDAKRTTATPAGGFVRVSALWFVASKNQAVLLSAKSSPDHAANCRQELDFPSDPAVSVPYHTPVRFKVRNVSKFQRYFVAGNPAETPAQQEQTKELFSSWSAEVATPIQAPYQQPAAPAATSTDSLYLLNNQKPNAPQVCKIVPLVVQDDNCALLRETCSCRVSIFFKKESFMQPGHETRVAVPVRAAGSAYQAYLKPWRARGGSDAVTDSPAARPHDLDDESCLPATAFVLAGDALEVEYICDFDQPYYDLAGGPPAAPGPGIGCISYRPLFDDAQQLWYINVHLHLVNAGGRELHTAFVQLSLMSHQPYSANYNEHYAGPGGVDTPARAQHDLRFSTPTQVDFFSVLPSRQFSKPYVLFSNTADNLFGLSCDLSSLFFREMKGGQKHLATQFLLAIERQTHGDTWELVASSLTTHVVRLGTKKVAESLAPTPASYYHHLLPANLTALAAGFDPDTTQLECQLSLTAGASQGWLLHRRHFRAAIYEVDLHDDTQDLEALQKLMRNAYDPTTPDNTPGQPAGASPGYQGYPGQLPHVHVRYCHVFYKDKS